jgi:hypothetical protein
MERSVEASTTVPVAYARARKLLLDDPGVVFSDTVSVGDQRARRFQEELSVNVGAGASLHQEVALQLGAPRSTKGELVLPVAWQATGRTEMLPSFKGSLHISEHRAGTGLRVSGTYTIPLGIVGRFGDGVVGRRLARRSLASLAERLARRLKVEVERQVRTGVPLRRPRSIERPEGVHSEIYLG